MSTNISNSTSSQQSTRFTQRKLVIAVLDLAGFSKACRNRSDIEVAEFLDDYYNCCYAAIKDAGGRVVKYMGDSCMAVFEPENCAEAVECIKNLRQELNGLGKKHSMTSGCGANIHLASVAEGQFGAGETRHYDIFGAGVNHVFTMGGGGGLRISEPVYRQLPNDARFAWDKSKPPALYTLAAD